MDVNRLAPDLVDEEGGGSLDCSTDAESFNRKCYEADLSIDTCTVS